MYRDSPVSTYTYLGSMPNILLTSLLSFFGFVSSRLNQSRVIPQLITGCLKPSFPGYIIPQAHGRVITATDNPLAIGTKRHRIDRTFRLKNVSLCSINQWISRCESLLILPRTANDIDGNGLCHLQRLQHNYFYCELIGKLLLTGLKQISSPNKA